MADNASSNRTLLLCLLLAVGTIVLYARVAHNSFLKYDDDHYVTDNWHIRAGLQRSTVVWAFTSFDEANWHPLTWLSHALDVQFFGLNPARHHEVNVLIHAANALLLFLILLGMTGFRWRSFTVAVLFAIHPINVESVAWIAERKTVLCMFFFLLALIAYRHYVRRPTLASYFLVLLLSAMSLMAKPMAVTLPFTLLLVDYWPLGRIRFSPKSRQGVSSTSSKSAEEESIVWLLVEKLPLFLLCAASSILTLKAQRAAGAISLQHAFAIRLENAVVSYVLYLGKAFWPIRLAALYPYPGGGWPLWAVVLSSLLLLLITALVLKLRNHHYLAWGWFWFLGTMVPMVGLVHVGNQSMADRYAYLPFIGLFVIVVWGASELAAHFHLRTRDLAATAAVFIVLLSILTYRQLGYWRDDYSLWSHTLAVTRNNFVAEDSLGEALIRRGKYYEGIAHFRTAAEIEPGDAVSQINLGIYAIQHGDLSQAAARLGHALQLTADPHLLATAYANLGSVHFSLHDYDRARRNFESALQWKATFPFIFRDLGVIAQKSGDWNSAIRFYAMYAAAEPSDVAYFLFGQALEHSGDTQRANLAYAKAQEISSDMTKTRKQADSLLAQ